MVLLHDAPLLPLHARVIKASADHPLLVRPHWRNAVAAPVNRFTRRHPNRHFCDGHHTNVTPGNPETFLGMMVEEVMIAANPAVSGLEAACGALRRNEEFISIPKLLKELKWRN